MLLFYTFFPFWNCRDARVAAYRARIWQAWAVAFVTVAKRHVGELMEECLMWKACEWADSDLPAALCVTLRVAVQVLELNPLDVQSLKRLLLVASGMAGLDGRKIHLGFSTGASIRELA